MRYLITGTPRSRTAWLSAVMMAHGSTCYHDALANSTPLGIDAGISDPGIGCTRPGAAIAACKGPIVVIMRKDWRQAFERWLGSGITDDFVERAEANLARLKPSATKVFPVAALEEDSVVGEIIQLCTGQPPNPITISLMQRLWISEDQGKMISRSESNRGALALSS